MPTGTEVPAAQEPMVQAGERVTMQVRDALALLDFAIGTGAKGADGHQISPEIISTIQTTAANLGLLNPTPEPGAEAEEQQVGMIPAAEWVKFELAYYNLATALSPVTAETLRDTEGTSRAPIGPLSATGDRQVPSGWQRLSDLLLGFSPAQRFTRGLWIVAIGFGLFVILSEWALQLMALADNAADDRANRTYRTILELLVPWAYGGLGSCVYLLRSGHTYIYQRTFDLRHKPEYFNRILLGTFAGGAIILFVNQIAGEEGAVIQLSSAALGFLAGYSTDFLFNTIERIISALLPKVGIATVQTAAPPPAKQLDLNDLVDRYDKATGPTKDFYQTLIEHATGTRSSSSSPARRSSGPRGQASKPDQDQASNKNPP